MSRYKGFPYPIERTVQGLFQSGSDINQLKASMLTIIMTKPGERVFRPTFGTPLYTLANQDSILVVDKARQMIASALQRWEKRIQVTGIDCTIINNPDGRDLHIHIEFIDPMNMQMPQQLNLQIPLEGV